MRNDEAEDSGSFSSTANIARCDTCPRGCSPDRGRQDYQSTGGGSGYSRDYRRDNDRRSYGNWCRDDDRREGNWRRDDDKRDRRDDMRDRHTDGGGGYSRQGRSRQDRAPTPYVNTDCQICKIRGHPASDYWWRYSDDKDDDGDRGKKSAHIASYGVDSNWYTDTGATDHITNELNKLSTHEKYNGNDRVHTTKGTGMNISHIGHSVLRTPHGSFDLNNILHVPNTSKNLLSVHKFTLDNHVFIEFHPFFFLIKDIKT
jgi:hypothetical protein